MRKRVLAALVLIASIALLDARPDAAADIPQYLWFGNVPSDGLRSDGGTVALNGVVADYTDGLQNVLAIIQSTGNFRFSTAAHTRKPVERAVVIDFGTQFADRGLTVPFSNGAPLQRVDILEAMHAYPAGDVAILSLRYPQSVQKLVRFTWVDGGYYYRLGYGSDMDQDGVLDSPPVIVTCIAPQDPARPCGRWALTPQQAAGTAGLFRFRILKNGEGAAEALGTFAMAFSQTFSGK